MCEVILAWHQNKKCSITSSGPGLLLVRYNLINRTPCQSNPKINNHFIIWNLQSIASGIIAILMSRNLHVIKLVRIGFVFSHWYNHSSHSFCVYSIVLYMLLSRCLQQIGLLIASFLNALLSAACCTGLLLAISLTVAHNGKTLMPGCNDTQVSIDARSPVSARCPFDTTRIYVSQNFSFYVSLSLKMSTSILLHISLCFSPIFPLSVHSSCSFWGMKFHKSITGEMFDTIVLFYFTLFLPISSCVSGHHPGAVGPFCCVGSVWGRTVCLVLHRWIGSQRAGTLWEQLHQRAGVCVFCVGVSTYAWGV